MDACVCVLTPEVFEESFDTQVPEDPNMPVGWLETDMLEGQGNSEPPVRIGDILEPGAIVILDENKVKLCGGW